jgi:hypothetical protein
MIMKHRGTYKFSLLHAGHNGVTSPVASWILIQPSCVRQCAVLQEWRDDVIQEAVPRG